MSRWIFVLCCLLFLQTACDQDPARQRPEASILHPPPRAEPVERVAPPPVEPLVARDLLNEPVPVHRFETTAAALTIWRRAAPQRPTLLLLANNPHLDPVPEELRRAAAILINNANAEHLAMAATDRNPAPILLPGMAIDAALRSGWFRELAWALPLRDPAQDLSLAKFAEQLEGSGIVDAQESASLTLTDRVFAGVFREVPVTAAALPLLQELSGPVVVHIDLSYFQPLYKNEIATPLLDIVYNTLAMLKKMHLQTLAVTFSYGHLDSQMALDVRFLGEILAYLIEDPARLDKPVPVNWQRQRDALYLANFFQKEKVLELYTAQEKDDPNAAWVKFNLYRSAAERGEAARALDYLTEAVAFDPIYALEYLDLGERAYERGQVEDALHLLEQAAEVFPGDPFIKLRMAQLANELGEKGRALELLNGIRNLEWSQIYYPEMPKYIADLTAFVQSRKEQEKAAESIVENKPQDIETDRPAKTDTTRQRVLHAN